MVAILINNPMNKIDTINLNVFNNENDFTNLMSRLDTSFPYERYYDDSLKDMYDHNFFKVKEEINEDILSLFIKYKENRKEGHLKICSSIPQPYLIEKGFDNEIIITMVKDDDFNINENTKITYSSYKNDPSLYFQMVELEILYYGNSYGIDFCKRRWDRYQQAVVAENEGLDFFYALLNGEVVAYCYAFYKDDVVGIDGLLVKEEVRKQGIASSLLKYISSLYKCPIYLHAEESDTPIKLYRSLGFKEIEKSYDYLKLDK